MREALNPTRRNMLGRLAVAAPLAGAVATAALAEPVDPHLGWEAELVALTDWYNGEAGAALDDDAKEPTFARMTELEDRLHLTEARTLAGVRAQLRNAVRDHERGGLSFAQQDGLAVTLAALDRLAAEAERRRRLVEPMR